MMEKHKCKICFRTFSNGKALGGHMRSHMMNLPIHQKQPESLQLSFEASSASSPSSYGLGENPKRSFRFMNPNQFVDTAGSIILQDIESEAESSKNPTRPRTKRVKKLDLVVPNESGVSSSSDITTEEDIAFCLMLLSRDSNNNWKTQNHPQEQEDEKYERDEDEEDENEESETESELEEVKRLKKVRGKYKCDTCNKVFRSYQALGGHRASHKKIKLVTHEIGDSVSKNREKIHECPICFREFSSGQALGGHKRTHGIGSTTSVRTNVAGPRRNCSANFGESLLDLNFPAPMDDDVSQIEGSDVSNAEFVKPL